MTELKRGFQIHRCLLEWTKSKHLTPIVMQFEHSQCIVYNKDRLIVDYRCSLLMLLYVKKT